MAGYTKQFLIDGYLSRFMGCPDITPDQIDTLERLAEKCYDTYGKDKFRVYASLDAQAIRTYKNSI